MIQTLDLFRPLDGQDFACDRELQETVLAIFNAHLAEMPPGYLYTQLIEWGRRQGWIRRTEAGWSVRLPREGDEPMSDPRNEGRAAAEAGAQEETPEDRPIICDMCGMEPPTDAEAAAFRDGMRCCPACHWPLPVEEAEADAREQPENLDWPEESDTACICTAWNGRADPLCTGCDGTGYGSPGSRISDQRPGRSTEPGAREGKAAPTPAPWVQGDNKLFGPATRRMIYAASLATDPSGDDAPQIASFMAVPFGPEEAEANARLACAAPALLAACHRAHAALDAAAGTLAGMDPPAGSWLDDLCGELQAARDACEGALAHAEGDPE